MQRPSLWILIAVYLGASGAHAALVVYDGFNYSTGSNLIGGSSLGGDSGWTSGSKWTDLRDPRDPNFPPETTAYKITNSKPTISALSVSGQAATTNGTNANFAEAWRTLSTTYDYNTSGLSGTSKLWISFVLRKDATANSDDYGVLQLGNLAFGASSNGKYSLENKSSSAVQASTVSVSSTPVLVIACIDFGDASSASVDTVKLYYSTNLSSGLPSSGSPIATMSFDVGPINTVGLVFGWGGAGWSFDEIRMATASSDATGMSLVAPAPEPSMLGLPILATAALLRRRRRLATPAAVEVH
jgi:hypothetical protein